MCKVKFKTYVLLHRIVHDFSTKNLIKSLRAGEDVIDDLVGFMHIDKVNNAVGLTHQIMILKKDTERLVKSIADNLRPCFDSRKQLAIFVLDNFKPIADAVFRAIDGKDIEKQV